MKIKGKSFQIIKFRVDYKNRLKLLKYTEGFQYDKINLETAFSSDAKAVFIVFLTLCKNEMDTISSSLVHNV